MIIKCIVDDRKNLTEGKIYNVQEYKIILGKIYYRIQDDSGGYYMYSRDEFTEEVQ